MDKVAKLVVWRGVHNRYPYKPIAYCAYNVSEEKYKEINGKIGACASVATFKDISRWLELVAVDPYYKHYTLIDNLEDFIAQLRDQFKELLKEI